MKITDTDREAAEKHFARWYPDTAWGFEALVETLARHRLAAIEQAARVAEEYDTFDRDVVISANRAAVSVVIATAIRQLGEEA